MHSRLCDTGRDIPCSTRPANPDFSRGEMLSEAGTESGCFILDHHLLTLGSPTLVAGSQSWTAVATSAGSNQQHRLTEPAVPQALQSNHTSQDPNPGVLQTSKALASADSMVCLPKPALAYGLQQLQDPSPGLPRCERQARAAAAQGVCLKGPGQSRHADFGFVSVATRSGDCAASWRGCAFSQTVSLHACPLELRSQSSALQESCRSRPVGTSRICTRRLTGISRGILCLSRK